VNLSKRNAVIFLQQQNVSRLYIVLAKGNSDYVELEKIHGCYENDYEGLSRYLTFER